MVHSSERAYSLAEEKMVLVETFIFLNRTGGEKMMITLVGWDKDREITYELLSVAKLLAAGEN